jgi:hypothetical protein
MTNCKFSGFRRILYVDPGSQARFKECVVDVAIPGSLGDGPKDNLVVGACSFACHTGPIKIAGVP